eukprot:scaffold544613_cov53-Prasinocladus_malaysianus.AAC.1
MHGFIPSVILRSVPTMYEKGNHIDLNPWIILKCRPRPIATLKSGIPATNTDDMYICTYIFKYVYSDYIYYDVINDEAHQMTLCQYEYSYIAFFHRTDDIMNDNHNC